MFQYIQCFSSIKVFLPANRAAQIIERVAAGILCAADDIKEPKVD